MTTDHSSAKRVWQRDTDTHDLSPLDELVAGGRWDGPLVVSMPRTGSTLLGTIFLLLHDADGDHVFDRYIHEPTAPLFWQDTSLADSVGFLGGRLGAGDIVQESAYQFAARDIAGWFLNAARSPVCFVMRHPQQAWPSRWRIMLREWLSSEPGQPDAVRIRAALDDNDFSDIGDLITTRVSQPDNGWYPFMSLIDLCDEQGLEFMIVDNARFRADPDAILAEMCSRWGEEYEDSMTTWQTLDEARPRVVMSELATGTEYDWYYARTLGSTGGIVRVDQPLVPLDRFPEVLRGDVVDHLTIDQAVAWYEELLARPEPLG
jgi:hypothetical protein